MGQPVLAGTTS